MFVDIYIYIYSYVCVIRRKHPTNETLSCKLCQMSPLLTYSKMPQLSLNISRKNNGEVQMDFDVLKFLSAREQRQNVSIV